MARGVSHHVLLRGCSAISQANVRLGFLQHLFVMAESLGVRASRKRAPLPSEGSLAGSEPGSTVAAESEKSAASRGSAMLRWVAGSEQSVDSGFSFEGELNQQDARSVESDVQTAEKEKGKKTKKDKGTGAQATTAGKQCSITICEEVAAGTSPYCSSRSRSVKKLPAVL